MRYRTPEWYEKMQHAFIADEFEAIPDGNYSDSDIKKLYDEKLNELIDEERDFYNKEQQSLFAEEDLDELLAPANFVPEDWAIIDEVNNRVTFPKTPEEVRARLKADEQLELEAFRERPPFDEDNIKADFKDSFEAGLDNARNFYPSWLSEEVDERLIALGYLTERAYMKLNAEMEELQAYVDDVIEQADRVESEQTIPEHVCEALALHDANVLEVQLDEPAGVLEMVVSMDGVWPEEGTPYRHVVFHDVEMMQADEFATFVEVDEEGDYLSNLYYLYDEIYNEDYGYEVHMMFASYDELPCVTVRCSDVTYEDNYEYRD